MKQVSLEHYDFRSYESAERFTSYWHQIDSALAFNAEKILEIGKGSGVFSALSALSGLQVTTLDIDVELRPTVAGSVLSLPFANDSFELTVAFQILEHLPFEMLTAALSEMQRISSKGILISLPDVGSSLFGTLKLPFLNKLHFQIPHHRIFKPQHRFTGEHYWEINKRGYSLGHTMEQISKAGLTCRHTWLNHYHPYHRFFDLRRS